MGNLSVGSQYIAIGGATAFGHFPFVGMKFPSDKIRRINNGDFDVGTENSEQLNQPVESLFATKFGHHIGVGRDQDSLQRFESRRKLPDPAFVRPKEICCRGNLFMRVTLSQLVAQPEQVRMEERLSAGNGNRLELDAPAFEQIEPRKERGSRVGLFG